MRFNSLVYWFFLPTVVLILWALPPRARRWWLLGTSYIFYASWNWPYVALLFGTAAINHWGAKWIVAGKNRKRRGAVILTIDVIVLAAFKYLDWLIGNFNGLAHLLGFDQSIPFLNLVLPLGVSFYTFEAMSYIVDIVRKRERIHSFWDFQLYLAFFPHSIAGPILRAKEFLPQIESKWKLKSGNVSQGLWLIISGLFLKIVLADGLAPGVDASYARMADSVGSTDVYLMGVAFGLQIYFDFSAYTRIAIGSAKLCGIEFQENFNYPYSARSPVDFWSRWHMTLSRWIRDYLFYPMAGKRPTLYTMCRAAVLSMVICGVWHGAAWTFVLWGLYHGILNAGYHLINSRSRLAGAAPVTAKTPFWWSTAQDVGSVLLTFGLVSMGWVFFRARGIEQALQLWSIGLTPWSHLVRALPGTLYLHVAVLTLGVWLMPALAHLVDRLVERVAKPERRYEQLGFATVQGLTMGVMVVLCLVYLRGQTAFIYFQF